MPKLQKFLFDTDFGMPRSVVMAMAEPEDEMEDMAAEPEPPPAPTFSEEELTLARDQAFEAGRQEGLREAAATLEQMVGMAMATCAHYLQGLNAAQAEANEGMLREATLVAVTLLRKLQPEFCRLHGVGAIERAVAECLEHRVETARITVRVAPDLVEAVEAKCAELAGQAGYEGKLIVTPDPALGLGDCRVDWGDGGAEQNGAKIWADIDRIAAETIGVLSTTMAEE